MLLDVKRTRVEAELPSKEAVGVCGEDTGEEEPERIGKQLSDHYTNSQGVLTEPEELVDKGKESGKEETEEPGAESSCGQSDIVCWRHTGSDFLNGLFRRRIRRVIVRNEALSFSLMRLKRKERETYRVLNALIEAVNGEGLLVVRKVGRHVCEVCLSVLLRCYFSHGKKDTLYR
jgi:hypothetical protein